MSLEIQSYLVICGVLGMICCSSFHMSSTGIWINNTTFWKNAGFAEMQVLVLTYFCKLYETPEFKTPTNRNHAPILHKTHYLHVKNSKPTILYLLCAPYSVCHHRTAKPSQKNGLLQVVRMIAIELLNQICILRGSQSSLVAEQDEKINRILFAKGLYLIVLDARKKKQPQTEIKMVE